MHWNPLPSHVVFASLFLIGLGSPAHAGKYSSGGGRSYSSSSSRSSGSSRPSPSPSFSAPRPSTPSPSPSFNSTRSSYSSGSGSTSQPASSYSRPAASSSSNFDSAAAKAKQVQQSAQNFAQTRPAPPPLPASNVRPAPQPSPPRTSYSSRPYSNANTSNFNSAPQRTRVVNHYYPAFGSYYSRPVVIYQDSYSSPFWYWLLDQPRPVRAAWYYNHQTSMDPARQQALLAADPTLPQAVTEVAQTTPTPDPNYTPPGIEPQAMTAKVEAEEPTEESTSTTIVPVPVPLSSDLPVPYDQYYSEPASRSSSIMSWLILLGGGTLVTWLVFFKRWKPATA